LAGRQRKHLCRFRARRSLRNATARAGNSRWRRITELRGRAKSVFHFDVPGSVAKSTHAGIPWLRYLRIRTRDRAHLLESATGQISGDRGISGLVEPQLPT
jgi:hypothetical protein